MNRYSAMALTAVLGLIGLGQARAAAIDLAPCQLSSIRHT